MGDTLVHEALFYRDSAEFVAGTLPFVEAGLLAGEPVMVAVPGPNIDALAEALGPAALGVRFADMRLAGRNPGCIIPWVLYPFVHEHPGRRVRVVGEPIWAGRDDLEYPACVQHEAMINEALRQAPASIICPYDTFHLDPTVLADARRTHPVLVTGDERTTSPEYAPEAVVADYNLPLAPPPPDAAVLPFTAGDLSAIPAFVDRHARRLGLSAARASEVRMVVDELVGNVITHGGGRGRLSIWPREGVLACEVRDEGSAGCLLVGRVPPPLSSPSGRGIVLVNYLADFVRSHVGPAGTTVLAMFHPGAVPPRRT